MQISKERKWILHATTTLVVFFLTSCLFQPDVNEGSKGYNRKEWHPRWEDRDGDCQNTRHEVLIEESLVQVTLSTDGCRVISGEWKDPYSGKTFSDPRDLNIDHLVPLKEAHISGGGSWNTKKKRKFANDLRNPETLIAVSKSENFSKGAKDPSNWLPSNQAYHCEYVRAWKRVKSWWGLQSDAGESMAIREIEKKCRQLRSFTATNPQ